MMMKKIINRLALTEVVIVPTSIYSFEFFINLQVAYLSALFIVLGTSFAYKKMINSQVSSQAVTEDRDLLDKIEDPHELFEQDINNAPAEELDLKAIVKEEKAKVKVLSIKNMKHGARGSMSAFRLVPYAFLILGFIALKNNELLNLSIYLPSLFIGIIMGSIFSKSLAST
jgi:hypothetical protein